MRAPTVRLVDGDWGGAAVRDVEAVARSVASGFPVFEDHEAAVIAVEPTPSPDDPPITLTQPNATGESVVRLNIRGNLWARLVYQFAHELCHVIADPTTWRIDRFAWLEEALCETASLCALRRLAVEWSTAPPYPNWSGYAVELERYAVDRIADPAHSLPAGVSFSDWLAGRLPLLEADLARRDDNTVVSKELLPVFEATPGTWVALRHLHRGREQEGAELAELMQLWAAACPPALAQSVAALGSRLRVG